MKALILAGGRGSRLEEKTSCTNKCLLELSGRPVIEYNLDRAVEAKVDGIILLVGHCAENIINRYGIIYKNTTIRYVIQWEQKGLVHAIETCKNALDKDNFFLLLGDEVLVNSHVQNMCEKFYNENLFALCGVVTQPDLEKISRTYTVFTNEKGHVLRLIEKPIRPVNPVQGTGHCIFNNSILDYIERTPIHHVRGEKELPDLIQCAVDDGKVVKIFEIASGYTNINFKDDLDEANRLFS